MCVALGASLVFVGHATSPPGIRGKALSSSEKPIAGVKIYAGKETCCPAKRAVVETDKDGAFDLSDPGALIYVRHPKFRPVSRILHAGEEDILLTLEDATATNRSIPSCSKGKELGKRMGFVFRFLIPRGSRERHGYDVDYAYSYVSYPNEKNVLQIMSGPLVTWGMPLPFADRLLSSESFEERWIVGFDGGWVGIDASGRLRNGNRWRQVTMAWHEASWYDNVSDQAAASFDKILDSVCIAELPADSGEKSKPTKSSKR